MLIDIVNDSCTAQKNILIVGAPRSGTHALASLFLQLDPTLNYRREICMGQQFSEPWQDIKQMLTVDKRLKLAHIVQSYSKIFLVKQVAEIKQKNIIVEIRRRNKLKQFASWIYFKHIGAIYNFDHFSMDYIEPASLTVSLQDIENFIIDQIVDFSFNANVVLYYEDLNFSTSRIQQNQYVYPIEQVIKNFDLAESYLKDWSYDEQG